eukprot:6214846-Pleurochrysis_carterae.AAC.3
MQGRVSHRDRPAYLRVVATSTTFDGPAACARPGAAEDGIVADKRNQAQYARRKNAQGKAAYSKTWSRSQSRIRSTI